MLFARFHRLLFTCVAAFLIALSLPAPAWTSRLETDLICGDSAASRTDLSEDNLPDIACTNALVVDADGTVYFERDADAEVTIASITKVMTAIIALENAQFTDIITVDHAAATVGESSADLEEGDTLSLAFALKALMMPSGNDAAMAIATSVGALIDPAFTDPYQTFINAMNEKAAELEMSHSVFTNPHGLDFGDWTGELHSTARDVAVMFSYAMQNENFRALMADTDTEISVTGADGDTRTVQLSDRNKLRGQQGCIGGKTGSTYSAGACFVGAFLREGAGGEVYTVVLGSTTDDERWAATTTLADWYYSHWISYPLLTSSKTTPEGDPLVARATHMDWSDKTVDVILEDSTQTCSLFNLAGEVSEESHLETLSGDVVQGQEVGMLTLYQDGNKLEEVALVAAEDLAAPNLLEWLLIQFDRLVRSASGASAVAGTQEFFEVPSVLDPSFTA